MNNKIYAIQVDPEYQESPFEFETWDNVIFYGNKNYKSNIPPVLAPVFERFHRERLCDALRHVTGKKWIQRTISGCTQSEWQEIYFPAGTMDRASVECLESEYFNIGSEWGISTGAPNDPNAEIQYYLYCSTGNARTEIARAEGIPAENVVLFAFDGYTKTPKYKEV